MWSNLRQCAKFAFAAGGMFPSLTSWLSFSISHRLTIQKQRSIGLTVGDDMRSRRTTLNPLLRCAAAGMLALWVSAVVLCQVHCSCQGDDAISGKTLATRGEVSSFHHENKDAPSPADHHDDSLCVSLKSTALADNTFTLVHPASALLYTLSPSTVAPNATIANPPAPFFRQSRWPDWALTPEVSLGLAFRSLAPPVSSLG